MKIKELKTTIEELPDNDEIFVCFFTREEADNYAEDSLDAKALNDKEWSSIVAKLESDEVVWAELYSAFRYYIENKTQRRLGDKRKVRFHVNSK